MGKYEYDNGIYHVTTYIRDDFKRFHTMNAQYRIGYQEDFGGIYNNSSYHRFKLYQFVSYNTDIMQAMHDAITDTWIVSFNNNPFGYSRSTSRQVCRFVNEFLPFSPNDIRIAYENCKGVTSDIATYHNDNVSFDFHSSYTFHNVWRV